LMSRTNHRIRFCDSCRKASEICHPGPASKASKRAARQKEDVHMHGIDRFWAVVVSKHPHEEKNKEGLNCLFGCRALLARSPNMGSLRPRVRYLPPCSGAQSSAGQGKAGILFSVFMPSSSRRPRRSSVLAILRRCFFFSPLKDWLFVASYVRRVRCRGIGFSYFPGTQCQPTTGILPPFRGKTHMASLESTIGRGGQAG